MDGIGVLGWGGGMVMCIRGYVCRFLKVQR